MELAHLQGCQQVHTRLCCRLQQLPGSELAARKCPCCLHCSRCEACLPQDSHSLGLNGVQDEKFQSAPGSKVGTPAYLAPEVISTTRGRTYNGKVCHPGSASIHLLCSVGLQSS